MGDDLLVFKLCLVVICVFCVGCGPDVELATCRGVVQYEGKPLSKGKILFSPFQKGYRSVSLIQEDGSFELETLNIGGGVPPGDYRVSVVADIEIEGKEAYIDCSCPEGFSVTIEAGKENEINIHVQESEGWEIVVED